MSTFLLTWNPMKSYWDNYAEEQTAVELGYTITMSWSCGQRKNMPIGSRIFMMRLGYRQPIHGIFATGITVQEPFSGEHWDDTLAGSTTQYVEFELDAMLNPEIHPLFNPELKISTKYNWRPQISGIEIPGLIAQELEKKWAEYLELLEIQSLNLSKKDKTPIFREGQRSQTSVDRNERNPRARQACIDYYGTNCSVCQFDFAEFYGEIGYGFIHVHHLKPISAQDRTYEVDPIADLRPVCPNCHAMLHRKTPPFTIEQLRQLIGQ